MGEEDLDSFSVPFKGADTWYDTHLPYQAPRPAHLNPAFQSQCSAPGHCQACSMMISQLPDGMLQLGAPRPLAQWGMGSVHSDIAAGLKASPRRSSLTCQSQAPKLLACLSRNGVARERAQAAGCYR